VAEDLMAARTAVVLLAAGGLFTAAAGFAAVQDGDGARSGRGVYDPRAEALEELAGRLEAQQRSLERREKTVVEREQAIGTIEARLEDRAEALEALRVKIEALRGEVDAAHAERVTSVVRTVEAMKPAAAAKMIERLDRALAIEVLNQMASSKAGKLFAVLPPGLAADLAEGIVGPGGTAGVEGVTP
jgi:flagellar protein FlbB